MIRFLVRLAGCLVLAVAVVFAVGDLARSMSVDAVRLTSLAEAYTMLAGDAAGAVGADALWQERLGDLGRATGGWPASVVLGILALLLLAAGEPRRPSRRALR